MEAKTTKKACFRQVPPDQQTAPWTTYHPIDEWPDIYIAGNPRLIGLRANFLDYLSERAETQVKGYADVKDLSMDDIAVPEDGDNEAWRGFIYHECFQEHDYRFSHSQQWRRMVLSAYHGKTYASRGISGPSQGDWNICYYPVNAYEHIDILEQDYFNTCTEFHFIGYNPPETESTEPKLCNCYTYNANDVAGYIKELSAYLPKGTDIAVSLFTEYVCVRTPKYTAYLSGDEAEVTDDSG